jgi:hypothetical protein
MEIITSNYEKIEKEKIEELKFPSTEVLITADLIHDRKIELEKALSLGNLEQHKIRIYFEDDTSKKVVETTVWGVTDKRVILKKGVVIPIHRVHSIKL